MNLTLFKRSVSFVLMLCFFVTGMSRAQTINALPYTKTDNFNSYAGSLATLPAGWSVSGTAAFRGTGTGTGTTGGWYAFGTGSDFSLGGLRSGSAAGNYTISFTNNSGNTITSLVLSWNYEQWRFMNTSGWDCTGTGALASNAILNGKDFVGAASGTVGAVTPVASFTLSGLSIANGAAFGITWSLVDQSGSDNGIAIDDFTIQATGAGGPQNQTITFAALANQTYGATPYTLNASSTSGLTVNLVSSNTNVATISGSTITIVGAGNSDITASQAGNSSYNAATNVVRTLTVLPKALTTTGAVANSKVYDRTNTASITGSTLVGLVNGDVINITGGGTFAGINAGTSVPVTAALTLTGTKASSYSLTQPTGLIANITPKGLTILNATVSDKEYDGNTAAVFNGTLSGVISPDNVSLFSSASFDSPSVGNDIPVTSESTLSGFDIANYSIVQPTGLTADITPKPLTVSGAFASNKVYDGNTDAVISGTLNGVIAPDDVVFNGVGVFASPEVGTNIPVTSLSFITGDSANYTLLQPTGLTATISAQPLITQEITFDPLADAVYGDASFNLSATASSGLSVVYSSSDENIATVSGNTVTIVGVGSISITATQPGDSTYDQALPVVQTLNVLPKTLEVTNILIADKTYDGNTTASISGSLSGIVGTDDVALTSTATFDSANAANNIPVTPAFSISGASVNNYVLSQPSGLSADILPKPLVINSVAVNNKAYDGNTNASLGNINFTGVIAPDAVTLTGSGTFASPNVGSDIPVTASLSLGGAQATNYTFTAPTGLSANISPLELMVTGLSGQDKIYDTTTTAQLSGTATLSGIVNSEQVNLDGTPIANFNNQNVGSLKPISISGYTISGAAADNYTLAPITGITASIIAKPLTVSGAVANSKPYDGTTAATLSNTGTLSGIEIPDAANVSVSSAANFASAAIANNVPVLLSLTGSAASNYALTQPGITANITAAPCAASTVTWNFTTASPSTAPVANLSITALTQGNNNGTTVLITSVSTSNNAGASGGNNAGAAARIGALNLATSAYFEFKLTPSSGYKATLSAMNFGSRETGTGPKAYAIRSSLDNFTTNLATGVLPANSTWAKYTPAISPTSGSVGAEVTYRIYGYNGAGSPVAGTANWRIDDLNLTVAATAVLSGNLNQTACSGSPFTYTASSLASGTSFSWTRAAVAGISNAAVTEPQEGSVNEVLVNTTANPVTVTYAFQVNSGTCFSVENVNVQVSPESLGGVVSGSTSVCAGTNNTTLTLAGQRGTIVKWQSSSTADFSANISDIANTTSSLQVTNLSQTTYYRAVVSNAGCAAANSTTASITITEQFPFYADADGDTYGAGSSVNVCATNATTPPAGYSVNNLDCNDAIAAINPGATEVAYDGVDNDCDGSIDEGFPQITTSLLPSSCGTTLAAIGSLVGITTVSSAITGYRIKITSGAQVQTIEKNVPHFTFPEFPSYAYATTYTVEIELQRNGIWLGYYGPSCLVSTPAILESGGAGSVNPSQCGITLSKINTLIATTSLQGVTGYRFKITNLTDTVGPNAIQTIDRTQNWFSLPMLTRYNYGTLYRIEIAVKTTGTYGGYGAPCEVTSPAAPSLINCGGTAASGTSTVAATSVLGATQYRFQIVRASDNASATIDRSVNYFIFNSVPASAFTAGALYNIRVAVMTTGTWSPFGDVCEFTAPGAQAKGGSSDAMVTESEFKATAYPNPFTSDFAIDVVSSDNQNANVKVYDMLGRLMESTQVLAGEQAKLGNQYPSGVYNVVVTQGEIVKTLRVIKR